MLAVRVAPVYSFTIGHRLFSVGSVEKPNERTCAPTDRDPRLDLSRVIPIVLFALAVKVSLQLAVIMDADFSPGYFALPCASAVIRLRIARLT